jgi:hypothetical protein
MVRVTTPEERTTALLELIVKTADSLELVSEDDDGAYYMIYLLHGLNKGLVCSCFMQVGIMNWDNSDGNFMDQTKGIDRNRDKVRSIQRATTTSAGNVFLAVLEGAVYAIYFFVGIVDNLFHLSRLLIRHQQEMIWRQLL